MQIVVNVVVENLMMEPILNVKNVIINVESVQGQLQLVTLVLMLIEILALIVIV